MSGRFPWSGSQLFAFSGQPSGQETYIDYQHMSRGEGSSSEHKDTAVPASSRRQALGSGTCRDHCG